jgi:hypothetical protein
MDWSRAAASVGLTDREFSALLAARLNSRYEASADGCDLGVGVADANCVIRNKPFHNSTLSIFPAASISAKRMKRRTAVMHKPKLAIVIILRKEQSDEYGQAVQGGDHRRRARSLDLGIG